MVRHNFIIRASGGYGNEGYPGSSIATSITVNVPQGLTRQEAISYVTGYIAGEVSRYFASECLGLGPVDGNTKWQEKVT